MLAGKYRVERVLGAGGMGVVVSARHLQLDETVAIKLLHPRAHQHPTALTRFAREARAAAKIKSEHTAWISDVGTLENGIPYMVMEHLEGEDLARWLRERGPLSWTQAIDFLLQACEALAVAHASGIVHRDLKPANLFVTRRPDGTACVKVLDFGISRAESEASITQTAQVLGSPLYMSPEQLSAPESVDARSDIWSLGVILFELLSGKLPFSAASLPELVTQVMTSPPPSLTFARGEGATALDAVVRRCLEKERSRRYGSVAELARDLHPFAHGAARLSCERIAKILNAPLPEPHDSALLRPTVVPPRARRRALWATLALLLTGGAAAAVGFTTRRNAEKPPRTDSSAQLPAFSRVAPAAAPLPAAPVVAGPSVVPVFPSPSPAPTKREPKTFVRAVPRAAHDPEAAVLEPPREVPSSPPPPPARIDPFEDRK